MQHQLKYYFTLFLCLGLTSCSLMGYKGENKFESRLDAFSHAMRWSQFEDAEAFVRMRDEQIPSHNMDDLNQIRITKYEFLSQLTQKSPDEETTDIVSTYTIDYYNKGSYQMKHMRYEQLWWYDDDAGSWFLDSNLPQFD